MPTSVTAVSRVRATMPRSTRASRLKSEAVDRSGASCRRRQTISSRTADYADRDPGQKHPTDGRLAEGVQTAEDAAAREKCGKVAQAECGDGQAERRLLQRSMFPGHQTVNKGRARQPRHERTVLHGVPGPVAAPAELLIGPFRARRYPRQATSRRTAAHGLACCSQCVNRAARRSAPRQQA